jgi:hypothetical protein
MQDIFAGVCLAGMLADYVVQDAIVVDIVLRCVSLFFRLCNCMTTFL